MTVRPCCRSDGASGAECRVGRAAAPLVCCCSLGLLGVMLGRERRALLSPPKVFSLATGDCPSLSFSGMDSRECIDDIERRALPTVGETLRWGPGLLPPSGLASADEPGLGGGGEEQPSTILPVVAGSEGLLGEGLVGASMPLRGIGGENATSLDVKSAPGRAHALASVGAAGDACSGNTCLRGSGEAGGVLRLSASA